MGPVAIPIACLKPSTLPATNSELAVFAAVVPSFWEQLIEQPPSSKIFPFLLYFHLSHLRKASVVASSVSIVDKLPWLPQ
jgi:hypothetical protein